MKLTKLYVFLISFSTLFFYNCSKRNSEIDSLQFKAAVINSINSLDSTQQSFFYQVYDTANFSSFWFAKSHTFFDKIDIFNKTVQEVESEHGLNKSFFLTDSLTSLTSKIDTLNIDYSQLAKLELLLSKSYYDYCSAVTFGAVNPQKLYPIQYFIETKKPDSTFLVDCFEKISTPAKLQNSLNKIQPKDKIYKTLQNELEYLYLLKDSSLKQIPALSDKQVIQLNGKNRILPLVARRLIVSHELPPSTRPDTFTVLTKDFLKAINKFRQRYGIKSADTLDNSTIQRMNRNSKEVYWKIAANMERARWKPVKSISKKHVWVNCATQQLRMMRGDSIENTSIVGVGRSAGHQTPLLIGDMFQIVLNPTWTVPKSIVVKEISVKSNPKAYLERNNMKVFKRGKLVNPDSIHWKKINNKYQPYTIVQDSGATNSLGRVKFNFNNPFSIYLHDTNAKHIFNYNQRDVSHGCVRVQNPVNLAFFCLKDIDKHNAKAVKERGLFEDRIRYSIARKPQSGENLRKIKEMGEKAKVRYVSLNPKVTVIIDYRTCFTDKDNKLFFAKDIYNMDDTLISTLKKIR